jgi:hypothetical protein
MKVKVGQHKLGDISLPREAKVSHSRLHDYLLLFLSVDAGWVYGLEDLDCAVDAGVEFGECCFGVFEDGDVGGAEAGDGVFGCVGAGLDLVG